ncbi:MAG TPA: DUF2271 domain-containing protein [Propionicimonas sp.]|nr:DUF2271 domain-containing protein [Propionicimonas sp.]
MAATSRFSAVSRRALLQGVSTAALLGIAGCATDDAEVLTPTAGATTAGGGSTAPAPTATAPAGQFGIAFSYTADTSTTASAGDGKGMGGGRGGSGGGMVRNPYIAVWLEDSAGKLVRTISLWHLQNGQDRWLSELHRWYSVSGGVDTTSSATRAAGSYNLAWDLADLNGKPVANGTYTLCVEATREHGPYSLVTGDLEVTGKAITQELPGSGELSAVAIAYAPA